MSASHWQAFAIVDDCEVAMHKANSPELARQAIDDPTEGDVYKFREVGPDGAYTGRVEVWEVAMFYGVWWRVR